jgi:hypothetical protein
MVVLGAKFADRGVVHTDADRADGVNRIKCAAVKI